MSMIMAYRYRQFSRSRGCPGRPHDVITKDLCTYTGVSLLPFSSLLPFLPFYYPFYPFLCHRPLIFYLFIFQNLIQFLLFSFSYQSISYFAFSATTILDRRDESIKAVSSRC